MARVICPGGVRDPACAERRRHPGMSRHVSGHERLVSRPNAQLSEVPYFVPEAVHLPNVAAAKIQVVARLDVVHEALLPVTAGRENVRLAYFRRRDAEPELRRHAAFADCV